MTLYRSISRTRHSARLRPARPVALRSGVLTRAAESPACLYTVSIMYGRTNRLSHRLTRRQKRLMASITGLVLLFFLGIGLWGALAPDSYSQSSSGCVNVTIPGTTGGTVLHYCGSAARDFCRAVVTGQNQVAERARPQCRLAGLLPATPAPPSSSP